MARIPFSAAGALLLSCSGDRGSLPEPECTDTWESFGGPFLGTWCTSCHSAGLPVGMRYDAPPGTDFDTLEGARDLGVTTEQAASEAATGALRAAGEISSAAVTEVRDALAGTIKGVKVVLKEPFKSGSSSKADPA